jgi:hypothetical protein
MIVCGERICGSFAIFRRVRLESGLSVRPTARAVSGLLENALDVCDTSGALAGIRRATGRFDGVRQAACLRACVGLASITLRDAFN